MLLAGGCRVGNFIEPSVEANLLDTFAVAWIQAVNVDGVAHQSFGFSHGVT